ncbi:MAG: signal recognition particle-docking protein FtsY, partial [Dehalococcoidia bacterium]
MPLFKLFRRSKKTDEAQPTLRPENSLPLPGADVGAVPLVESEPAIQTIERLVPDEHENGATPASSAIVSAEPIAPVPIVPEPPLILPYLEPRPEREPVQDENLPDFEDEQVVAERTEEAVQRTRRTWFRRVTGVFERSRIDDELWEELEEMLIGADTGLQTTERILRDVKERIRKDGIKDPAEAKEALKDELVAILDDVDIKGKLWDAPEELERKPAVILVVGVNGVGKTTSIAKLSAAFKRDGERVLVAAADTFRAAAIDQIKMWGDRVGVEVIASQPNADAAAVVYDALAASQKRRTDVVIIDTAGRLHTKFNLMEELSKIGRTAAKFDPAAPHEVLMVLDATTGQNGLLQAKSFANLIGVTSIFLAKLDGTAKGGIVFSI